MPGQPSRLVKDLSRALAVDARCEIELAVKVGVLLAADHSRTEIAQKLEATPSEVAAAVTRLRRASEHLDGVVFDF